MTPRPSADAVVVGAGLMGRWHAREIRRVGGRVRAVVDREPARARALAAAHDGAAALASLDAALEAVRADLVHVCTPTASHAALTERALEAGLHVLVEKPVALDAATTTRLLERAGSHGLLLCPVHQFAFQRGARRLFDRLGELAPLRHADFVACSAGAEGGRDAAAVAREILPHPLSLLDRLTAGGLEDLAWSAAEPLSGELRATAAAEGFTASILVSLRGRPRENRLRVVGEGGTAHLNLYHGYGVFSPARPPSRLEKGLSPFRLAGRELAAAGWNLALRALRRQTAYPGLRELVRAMHRAALAGGPPPVGPGEVERVARAGDELRVLLRAGGGSVSSRSGGS